MKITIESMPDNVRWVDTEPGTVYRMDGDRYVIVVCTACDGDCAIDVITGCEVPPGSVFIPVSAELVIRDA